MSDRNRILCEFRNKTKSIMGDSLKQMILYGSYARGDYRDNSDMDIMVLTELTDDRIIQIEDEIFDAAYDIELKYGVPISVNIKNERHFKRHLLVSSSNSCPAAWMRNIGDLCWSALDCRLFYEIVGGNLICVIIEKHLQ